MELGLDERVLIKTQHFDTEKMEFDKKFFPVILGIVGLVIIIIYVVIVALNIIMFFKYLKFIYRSFSPLLGLVFFSMSCFLLISKFYETKTYLIITSARIMRLLELKHELKIKRQIKLSEISHIFDWYIALEDFPEMSDGSGYFNGTETEDGGSYKPLGSRSITIRFNDPKGESEKEEMKKIIIKNTKLQKHPNLEFLYYKFSL